MMFWPKRPDLDGLDIFSRRTVNLCVEGCRAWHGTGRKAKRRFKDIVKEDMASVGVRGEDAED